MSVSATSSELPRPTKSWKTNAETIIHHSREAVKMIPTLPFGIRLMVKGVGADTLVGKLAQTNDRFATEDEARAWFIENEQLFQKALGLYDMSGKYLNGDSADVAQEWKDWYENSH